MATGALGFSSSVIIDGETYNLTSNGFIIPEQTVGNGKGKVTISGSADADPAIAYGIAVVDFGAPSTFGFLFSIPILAGELPASPTSVNSSLVGGLTDFTGDGVSIAPVGPATLLQDNYLTDLPAFVWSVGPGAAFGAGPAGSFYGYGPYAFGPAPGPLGPFGGSLVTTLDFSLSGGNDIAALTGYCAINPVPVPPTLLLLGSGLLGMAGLRLRKK